MRDRVPTHPGRVRLVPVAGQDNLYDLVRADDAITEGMPLCKATLLPDSVCDVLGIDRDASTPADALAILPSKAPLASPSFTGTPRAPTPATTDSSTRIATTAFATAAVNRGIVVGSYDGNDASSRTISLGFTPRAVIVYNHYLFDGWQYGGIATTAVPASSPGTLNIIVLKIVSGGFEVYASSSRAKTNNAGEKYSYIAIR